MENKKDIGSAFKDKLKNLDKSPSDALWSKIENDLNTKKKRRSFVWLFPALLILGLSSGALYYFFPAITGNKKAGDLLYSTEFNQSNPISNKVGNTRGSSENEKHLKTESTAENTIETKQEAVNSTELENSSTANSNSKTTATSEKEVTTLQPDQENPKIKSKKQTGIAESGGTTSLHPISKTGTDKTYYSREATKVTVTKKRLVKSTPEYDEYEVVKTYSYVVKKKKVKAPVKVKVTGTTGATNSKNQFSTSHPKTKVGVRKKMPKKNKPVKAVSSTTATKRTTKSVPSTSSDTTSDATKNDNETHPVTLQLTNTEPKEEKLDSLSTTPIVEKKKTKKIIAEVKPQKKDSLPKIKVYPLGVFGYVSPTLSFAKGNNSTIDTRLNNNSKTSAVQWSYGAYLCYTPEGRLSSRIGIGFTNLNFKTEDVPVNTTDYSNLSYTNGYSNMVIYNQSNQSEKMTLVQEISYAEVPLEVKYKVIDKKIGVNAIGGISILYLNKNKVTAITSNGNHYEIGKTKGLLDATVGINFGFGFDYTINKMMKLNVEPMIKYNLKGYQTISNSNFFSGNILTGLQLSF
ncbi:hypothetical protein [Flavobacterium sp. GCM10027622]|uniref:hypothetical protein n=1 Tax=unclassified Flavobacterium TaxID=196869 RepID=UPI003606C77F